MLFQLYIVGYFVEQFTGDIGSHSPGEGGGHSVLDMVPQVTRSLLHFVPQLINRTLGISRRRCDEETTLHDLAGVGVDFGNHKVRGQYLHMDAIRLRLVVQGQG